MIELLQKVRNRMLDTFFPAFCVGCGRNGNYICERCTLFLSEAEPICPRCYHQSITGEVHLQCQKGNALDGLVSIWEYEGVAKSLLYSINEAGVTHVIPEITELAFQQLVEQKERYTPFFKTLLSSDCAITFVPRYFKEEKRRGFNQALLIAKAMGRFSRKGILSSLQKLNNINLENDWDREKRKGILKDSFSFRGLSGKLPTQVVLVDDLWRSGVTLNECALVLKRSGVEKVWGFTLAKVA
jgi:ComF family protein